MARLRRLLWQPPRPHGQQPPERIVGPLELFYDLVVVVLIGQATRHLSGHLAWRGLGQYAAVFALVWIAWVNGSLHHELHGRDDARGRSLFLLQILVLVPLGAFIPEAGGGRGVAFALTAGVLFAVLALLWLLAARGDRPEDRRASRLFVTGSFLCAGILVASALLPAGARVLTWGLLDAAYLAGFAAVVAGAGPGRAAELIGRGQRTGRWARQSADHRRRIVGRRGRLRRLVDVLRLCRTPLTTTGPGRHRAVDAQPSAADCGGGRHGRGDGEPHPRRA